MKNTGQSETSYNPGISGSSIYSYDNVTIDSKTALIHISSPFWYYFTDYPSHYIPFTRTIFNKSKNILKFRIENGNEVPLTNIMTTRAFSVRVTNKSPDPITITDTWTASRAIFIPFSDPITLKPKSSTTFNFYFCPTERATHHTIIYFITNKGEIPFNINLFSSLTTPELPKSDVLYWMSPNTSKLIVHSPLSISHKRTTFHYDQNLFSITENDFTANIVRFYYNFALRPGNYLSFIHFTTTTKLRTLPLFLSVSSKKLLPESPTIVIQPVTSKDGFVEHNVTLVNPTDINFLIIHAQLYKNSPPNIKFTGILPPLVCPRNMKTVIGKITVNGANEGFIDTLLSISYEGDIPERIESNDLPIKASVIYGNLQPSESRIKLIFGQEDDFVFNVTNNFKVPVVFISVKFNSYVISLTNFSSFIVQPGKVSPNFRFKLNHKLNVISNQINFHMIIETNATVLKVPISFYTGNVIISQMDYQQNPFMNQIKSSKVVLELGEVLCETTKKFSFQITNNNPSPFVVRSIKKFPGIEVENFWLNIEDIHILNFTVPPFESKILDIFITFANVNLFKTREDELQLIGDFSNVTITFSWLPCKGSISLLSSLPNVLILGKSYKGRLFVNSSYPKHVRLKRVTPLNSAISLTTARTFIKPLSSGIIDTLIGNFSFELNEEVLSNTKIAPLLHPEPAWYQNPSRWEEKWNKAQLVHIPFLLHFNDDFFLMQNIKIYISHSTYKDLPYDFGVVNANVPYEGKIALANTLNSTLRLCFHRPRINDRSINITALSVYEIPGDSLEKIGFMFNHPTPERVLIRIPVTSNATSPFFVTITANVVKPTIDLLDSNKEKISQLVFMEDNDTKYIFRKWTKKFYIRNSGNASIDVSISPKDNFNLTNKGFGKFVFANLNCEYLAPGEIYPFEVSINILRLPKWNIFFPLMLKSCNSPFGADLIIKVSKNTGFIIDFGTKLLYIAAFTLLLLTHIMCVLRNIGNFIQQRYEIQMKLAKTESTIHRLSHQKVNIGIQFPIKSLEGTFVFEDTSTTRQGKINAECLESLYSLIQSMK